MSSYQTLQGCYTDVRGLAGKDSTTLPDSTLLPIANKWYMQIVRELVSLNEDLYAEISSTALVANQREYPLPTDSTTDFGGGLIKLQRVEIAYDGINWRVGSPTSSQEVPGPITLDSDLNAQFDQGAPRYWFKDRSLWIAPVPSTSDSVAVNNSNLRIFWIKRPNEMTASTDIPDISKDFLNLLTEGMLYDVYRRYGRTSDARDALQNYTIGVAKMKEQEQNIDQEQVYKFSLLKKRYD